MKWILPGLIAAALLVVSLISFAETSLEDSAREAVIKGVAFFSEKVATRGGYAINYSQDLSTRSGWQANTSDRITVRPAGTPSVGLAFLRAYQATGQKICLEAALAAGKALVWGQMASGGWRGYIDFAPEADGENYYRREALEGKTKGEDESDVSSLFDNDTQGPVRLLMMLDHLTDDQQIADAAAAGLELMKESRFAVGAWPKRFPLSKTDHDRWYTYNDNLINNCIQTMLEAHAIYGKSEYRRIALSGGKFIIDSQQPRPQGGWAQQYEYDMKPAWARKFEPPGINAWVSARNIRTLMKLYLATGEPRFMVPIPAAVDWLESSSIEPDLWARFYEPETNRPVYMTSKYEVTYSDADTPTHYSFKGRYDIPETIFTYNRLKLLGREEYLKEQDRKPSALKARTRRWALENRVRSIIDRQDERGSWVTGGRITTVELIRNLLVLCEYLELVRGGPAVEGVPIDLTDIPLRGGSPGDEDIKAW